MQRDGRCGRLLGIDERGFPVLARHRRQLCEEFARQLVDEILGEVAAADEQPLRSERLGRLGLPRELVCGNGDRPEERIAAAQLIDDRAVNWQQTERDGLD